MEGTNRPYQRFRASHYRARSSTASLFRLTGYTVAVPLCHAPAIDARGLARPEPARCRLTQRWEASLWLNGRQLYLGGFNSQVRRGQAGPGQAGPGQASRRAPPPPPQGSRLSSHSGRCGIMRAPTAGTAPHSAAVSLRAVLATACSPLGGMQSPRSAVMPGLPHHLPSPALPHLPADRSSGGCRPCI